MTLLFPVMKGEKSAPTLIKLALLGLLVCSIIFYFSACFSAPQQETVAAAVDYIIDGDSLVIRRDTRTMEVRLWGIDAPEYDQPDSDSAKAALMKLAKTPTSTALSKDLKKRGFTFVGPTIMYAFMQAVGMVNDHLVSCFRYHEVMEG